MASRSPYPHGGDLSIYPTIRVMRDAYLFGYYRDYPHSGDVRIGPLPAAAVEVSEAERTTLAALRPVAHAVIILPRRVLLIRFVRRAALPDIVRLERERALVKLTPELVAVRHWRIQARLVHCDIADGVEVKARARGIKLALYRPRWLYTHRPRNLVPPAHGFIPRRIDPHELVAFVAAHGGAGKAARENRVAAAAGMATIAHSDDH
ncbi:MAG: hypothetical protein ACREQN_15910 [Candidatus Binataceae bacterium]